MAYTLPMVNVRAARQRISGFIRHTPLMPLPHLTGDVPPGLRLKLEHMQVTGSFKPRGVFNNLLQLPPANRIRGVVTASGGNHGLAVAYAADMIGIPATVYLPETASASREARITAWGAAVKRAGRNYDDARDAALAEAQADDKPFIHPFDSRPTLSGQATLGLELLEDLPSIDCVIVSIGGGGLIGGVASVIKALKSRCAVIGVEPVGAPTMKAAIDAGRVVELEATRTICDTLAPRAVSERTLSLGQQFIDDIVLVLDSDTVDAMRWLLVNTSQIAEPSGAIVMAAILTGQIDLTRFKHPVAILCGANTDLEPALTAYTAAASEYDAANASSPPGTV
jgi:threonine dehydratase